MNDPTSMATLFVDDCEVSYAPNFGAVGIEAYKKTLDGIGTFFKGTSHHNSNVVVDFVSETEADVRSIVLAVHRYTKERPDGILYGQYFDRVVKVDGQWKFKRRELLPQRCDLLPLTGQLRGVQLILQRLRKKGNFAHHTTEGLAENGRVELRGFGAFSTRARDARTGRNPRTGVAVQVPEKLVPYFKSGKGLRARINKD